VRGANALDGDVHPEARLEIRGGAHITPSRSGVVRWQSSPQPDGGNLPRRGLGRQLEHGARLHASVTDRDPRAAGAVDRRDVMPGAPI
jgi:hypothetical protein